MTTSTAVGFRLQAPCRWTLFNPVIHGRGLSLSHRNRTLERIPATRWRTGSSSSRNTYKDKRWIGFRMLGERMGTETCQVDYPIYYRSKQWTEKPRNATLDPAPLVASLASRVDSTSSSVALGALLAITEMSIKIGSQSPHTVSNVPGRHGLMQWLAVTLVLLHPPPVPYTVVKTSANGASAWAALRCISCRTARNSARGVMTGNVRNDEQHHVVGYGLPNAC